MSQVSSSFVEYPIMLYLVVNVCLIWKSDYWHVLAMWHRPCVTCQSIPDTSVADGYWEAIAIYGSFQPRCQSTSVELLPQWIDQTFNQRKYSLQWEETLSSCKQKNQNIFRNSDNDTDDVGGLQIFHPAIPDGRTWRTQRTWKDGKPKKNAVGRRCTNPHNLQ